MPKMPILPKWPAVMLLVLAAAGLIFYGAHAMKQPAIGVVSSQLSPRAESYVPPPMVEPTERFAEVGCFSLTLPIPATNLKTTKELQGYSSECVVKGSIQQPRAQFTISARDATNLLDLSEEPGVQLRLHDEQYTPITISQLSGYEHAAFTSATEVTAFWLHEGMFYVVSLHSLARVTDEVTAVHAQFVEAMLLAITGAGG